MGRNLTKSRKGLSTLQHSVYVSWIIGLAYLIVGHSLPYSFYVQTDEVTIQDVCVGSNILSYNAKRSPRWGMEGSTTGEIVRFEGNEVFETTIKRQTASSSNEWGYEKDSYAVNYDTIWTKPIDKVGEYGVNSWNTIYPLPFISVKENSLAEDNRFNVIVCEQ